MREQTLTVGPLGTNCYIICADSGEAAIIDPGAEPDLILEAVRGGELRVLYILNTHGHHDHVGADHNLAGELGVPIFIHPADASSLAGSKEGLHPSAGGVRRTVESQVTDLDEGTVLEVGDVRVETLYTPGHSPGSVTFKVDKALYVGDLLFQGSVGRTDLPGGSQTELDNSLRRIAAFPDFTRVYPGHGPGSLVGTEKKVNPFLKHL